ncbi:MAG: xanthine dehydrogenase family protein molybdopterin-binding subunit [Candidatus Eisenbacteria bacterium]|nr:xanthine dehydrogenase family protein molybdopterin-binding subunit [Candidatus Eisenbacteria bacterium]
MNDGELTPPIPRLDGHDKVTGRAQYVDDIQMPGMLHGATIRSTIARGRITGITFDPALDWSGFTIVTAADIPGKNEVLLLTKDQPFLADGYVRHHSEPILLLAHEDREMLRRAAMAITISYAEEPPCLDVRQALRPEFRQHGDDNTFHAIDIIKGDVDAGFESADLILDETYETGAQEQAYIEPQGMIARPAPDGGGVEIFGSLQCPYYVVKAVTHLLGIPAGELRVVQTTTGGGFGGKEEYPSIVAGHAALLALKSRRPVKLVYDRHEDILATTKRHPSITRVKAGVTLDGKLTALEIDLLLDGGAYVTLTPVVLSRASLHASGPYAVPDITIRARARLTNTPPHGAFRGFGAPQSIFALERHMDRLAVRLGLSPLEFRRRNYLKVGATMATGQIVRDDIDMHTLATTVYDRLGGAEREAELAAANALSPSKRSALGFAAFYHGAGFTGSGEERLASQVAARLTDEGAVEILSSNTEIGQGTITIFSIIAAKALGLDPSEIRVAPPDTARVPDSGPTVASRTAMVVGYLVQQAALDLAAKLAGKLSDELRTVSAESLRGEAFRRAAGQAVEHGWKVLGRSRYEKPAFVQWDETTYRGDAYATYAWAVYGCEVEVDTRTFEVNVTRFVANQDVGGVLHATLAVGQIQGGVVQGLGWALCEQVIYKDGAVRNTALSTYVIPTFVDVPPIEVLFAETPYEFGPMGAKGIGELPMDGPAPAVLNAIAKALGVEPEQVPCRPEYLMMLADAAAPVGGTRG